MYPDWVAEHPQISVGWSNYAVPLHTHACFYYSDERSLKRTLTFIRVGLDAEGDFNVIFADNSRHAGLLKWLQEGYEGDVQAALNERRLALVGGAPTREELLQNIARTLDSGLEAGNHLIRFLGFIAWGEPGWPTEDSLLEFEAQVSDAVRHYPAVIICTYGVPQLVGRQLIEGGLLTHPVVFLNNRVLTDSPLYLDPSTAREGA
ncbi:MAG TPA: MEDS domain-containing protein [Candidatus Nitrosotalea sp.]|nr:MEDS domain-containing protein [Candidatus Nitrosotalea sp.]